MTDKTQEQIDQLFKEVPAEEFEAFIKTYPRKLEKDVCGIYEPPLITWNDFERAPYWPDSIVAKRVGVDGNGYILVDLNSDCPDDGKRDTALGPPRDVNGIPVKEGDMIVAEWGYSSCGIASWAGPFDFYVKALDGWYTHYKYHCVEIRDKGTKYESWSFTDCANKLRGFNFEIVVSDLRYQPNDR